MKLVHYSEKPLGEIFSVPQSINSSMKPKGLWVSVEGNGDGWKEWCDAEQFQLHAFTHATEIMLAETAKILYLQNDAEIKKATITYNDRDFSSWIRWGAMVDEFDGIIIAPYCWGSRLDPFTQWYYGWDCASGCIWNAEAISKVADSDEDRLLQTNRPT